MSSGQQNQGSGQNMKGNDGSSRQGMTPEGNNQMRMGMQGGMPGGMQGNQMGFPQNMMNYGVPNFMQHLTGMGPMGGQMMPGMFPGGPQMMGQDMAQNALMQQNMGMKQDKFGSSGRQDSMKNQEGSRGGPSKMDEGKDQSKLQGEAKNSQLEKRDARNDPEDDNDNDEQDSKNIPQNKMARNQVSRREESDNSKGGSKDGPDDEDDDGKYNLRKRTRKENPYYYEFSDDDKQENVGRKRMKKFEDEYDPNEEENSNQKYMNKQQNQPNMSMGNMMDQNALSTQMMMQQMASRNQQMMNMPNLNESSGALNQMMGGYNQAQMSPQNYMQQKQQIPQKVESCGGSKQEGQGGMCPHCKKPKPPPELLAQILSLQNNRTAQMMQGMDYQQPFMMGANGMPNMGTMTGMQGMGSQTPTNNPATSASISNNNNTQARSNNQDSNSAYQMMNRGNMMGMGFPGQGFQDQNFTSQNFQSQGFPAGGMSMAGMGQYGGNFGAMGGISHGQQDNQSTQQDASTRNPGMMDMSQMSTMQGYGYPQGGNPMMNFQNMTPEQQMQMMQFRGMQGGHMNQNQMYPGGNPGQQ